MAKKNINFCVNQLIIEGDTPFTIASFSKITDDIKKLEMNDEDGKKEVLSIIRFEKQILEDRFITFYFNEGDKYPYSPKVMGPDLQEKENPRSAEEIELDGQFFVVIDTKSQRIFISDQRRKNSLCLWIKDRVGKDIVIKSIIQEKEFIDKIKSISKISFSIVPTLFNSGSEDTLSNNLVQDIHGFDAIRARIELDYENKKITDKIANKLKALLGRSSEFENIVVTGWTDEDFLSIFNVDEVINKITLEAEQDEVSKLVNSRHVFTLLLGIIKKNEIN